MRRLEDGRWAWDAAMARWYPEFGRPWGQWTRYERFRCLFSAAVIGVALAGTFGVGPLMPYTRTAYGDPLLGLALIALAALWMWWPRPEPRHSGD